MRIAVVGTGYVGLVSGACFADTGNDVVCVDSDPAKIEALQRGEVPIYEPGLEELIERNGRAGRLSFTGDLRSAVGEAEVIFLAVGTPEGADGSADLAPLLSAVTELTGLLHGPAIVVCKSTVPVGTADRVRELLAGVAGVEVASNPEFLKEGAAVDDFLKPDRVVIGTESPRAREVLAELYAPFTRRNERILFMDTRSAELTKYAANAMLGLRVSFMNEIARLCERVGADVEPVRQALGADSRIGSAFLFPGAGIGGSCIPKDLKALSATGRSVGVELELVDAVQRVNEKQKGLLLEKAVAHFGGDLTGRVFAVWGLAFKPRTDDMREAPSIPLVEGLLARGARVVAHDPVAHANARKLFGTRITYAETPYAALEGADALFVVTEWNEFRRPDFDRVRGLLKQPVILDGRNLYPPARMRSRGFTYYAIGRP